MMLSFSPKAHSRVYFTPSPHVSRGRMRLGCPTQITAVQHTATSQDRDTRKTSSQTLSPHERHIGGSGCWMLEVDRRSVKWLCLSIRESIRRSLWPSLTRSLG